MSQKRKFYKNTITLVILSEDAPIDSLISLGSVEREYTDGEYNLCTIQHESTEIDAPTTAKMLMESGSSPDFFRLDEEGNDA